MNILITGAWSHGAEFVEPLRSRGHHVLFLQQERDALPCDYEWVECAVCNGLFLHHPIERFTNLRHIQLTSAGYDHMPMEYIRGHGIDMVNASGVYSIPIAEHVLGGVLQLYRRAAEFRQFQQEHRWEKRINLPELFGKTVCILGCGSIGSECAKRFEAFGCRVLGIATECRSQPFFTAVEPLERLDSILSQADIVVIALPLSEETRFLLDEARISRMKEGSVLVNIARGAIVDTAALVDALKAGKLLGAALDVFEEEPLPANSPLWDMERILITPHNSFSGENNALRLDTVIMRNLDAIKKDDSIG